MESLLQNFFISFFTITYVLLDWISKFLFTENSFLPCLIKQESFRSLDCVIQSVYTLNMRSIKNPLEECRQGINYAINKTLCNILTGF